MKKKTLKRALYYAALFVLLIVFLFSAYKIYSYYAERRRAQISTRILLMSTPSARRESEKSTLLWILRSSSSKTRML